MQLILQLTQKIQNPRTSLLFGTDNYWQQDFRLAGYASYTPSAKPTATEQRTILTFSENFFKLRFTK